MRLWRTFPPNNLQSGKGGDCLEPTAAEPGGPAENVRRLYAGTIHAMLMYGAPVWAERMVSTRALRDSLRQLQRRVANCICRGFCTVSWTAVGMLSGVPPIELLACMYSDVYHQTRELQQAGITVVESIRRALRVRARRVLIPKWRGVGGPQPTRPKNRRGYPSLPRAMVEQGQRGGNI